LIITIVSDPWCSQWNYRLLELLFHYVPHSRGSDRTFEFLISNPLFSTWIYAAAFFRFWTKEDGQQQWRRILLLKSMAALVLAVLITLVIRPWIHWPAPVLSPGFQQMFPRYFWNNGNSNCFPSHSTLTYVIIAAGFWPLNRLFSLWSTALVILVISLPRVYVGGHYPIDVLVSCALGTVALLLVWRCPTPAVISKWLAQPTVKNGLVRDCLFFLWTFELGEGFRGTELLLSATGRILHLIR
jgi:membrane-associated phospholipid phosphatase